MKVFFDGKIFTFQKQGGISRLAFELIKSLNRKEDVEKIFYRGLYIDDYTFKKEWFFKYYGIKRPDFFSHRSYKLLDNIGMEFAYEKNATADLIYHSFYYRVPKNPKGPVVIDVHDMTHELFIDNLKVKNYKKKAFDKADLIISNSEATKKDLCNFYPEIKPEKVIIAYRGISQEILERIKFGPKKIIQRPYMFYVGMRNYFYKNFDFLLDAFISKKYFLDFDLVLMGGEKELTLQQKEKIKKTAGQGSWLKQEFGNDEKLADLYYGASVFIFPSLYEGFGIPLIEAMACSCPVVAANSSCIPEVAGDAALLFNPKDSNDLTNKIERVINDDNVAVLLSEKGRNRAKKFDWDLMTDIIYQGYLKLL
jgi:glycosyltransferase involved in cell wall biosynthesis